MEKADAMANYCNDGMDNDSPRNLDLLETPSSSDCN